MNCVPLDKIRVSNDDLNVARRCPEFSNMVSQLKEVGQIAAITINADYTIVDGLLRFAAALALGWEQIAAEVVGQAPKIVGQAPKIVGQAPKIADLAPGSRVQLKVKQPTAFRLGGSNMIHLQPCNVINVTLKSFSSDGHWACVEYATMVGTITVSHFTWHLILE